mgnify:CR=1 FL=1
MSSEIIGKVNNGLLNGKDYIGVYFGGGGWAGGGIGVGVQN